MLYVTTLFLVKNKESSMLNSNTGRRYSSQSPMISAALLLALSELIARNFPPQRLFPGRFVEWLVVLAVSSSRVVRRRP